MKTKPPMRESLFTSERREAIASLINRHGRVAIADLRIRFDVSEVTLRKDLAWLEDQGVLQRTYGGAIAAKREQTEELFVQRQTRQRSEKDRIGARAAALVEDGDTIALDASTTALAVAMHLHEHQHLTVITSGIHVALELAKHPNITVILPGGTLRSSTFSLVGKWETGMLDRIHVRYAFIGAHGCTVAEGLTDVNADEIAMKQTLIHAAREVYGIIDHTKWDRIALATLCPFTELHGIITDQTPPADILEAATHASVAILLPTD